MSKITAGICLIFRGLFIEHNADIGEKAISGWTLIAFAVAWMAKDKQLEMYEHHIIWKFRFLWNACSSGDPGQIRAIRISGSGSPVEPIENPKCKKQLYQ